MAFSEPYTLNAVTVGATELSVVTGTTTLSTGITDDGMYCLVFDPVTSALAQADQFIIRGYEKCLSGGTKRVFFDQVVGDAQARLWFSPAFLLIHGWDFTFQKLAGTDRAITASIRKIA